VCKVCFDCSCSLACSIDALALWCSALDVPDATSAGGVGKAKSPTLQERLQHQQRTARSSVSSACTGTSSDSTSGHSNGTMDGTGGMCGGTGASSAAGTGSWTEEDKAALLAIVQEVRLGAPQHAICPGSARLSLDTCSCLRAVHDAAQLGPAVIDAHCHRHQMQVV
jgi:hypothetical protein